MHSQEHPLVSLVMPTFNRAQLLECALSSIATAVTNTAGAVEVIVVDNASTDDTPAVVEKAARVFPCTLRYVKETNQGSSQARNRGLKEARGFYIVFMDDDQRMDRDYLKNIPQAFEQTHAVCVGGPVTFYNAQGAPYWLREITKTIGQINYGNQVRVLDDTVHKGLMGGNIAFIKSELEAAGAFDERLGRFADDEGTGEDHELQDRMRGMGKRIAYDPRLIQYHYLRPERFKKGYWRRYFYDYGRSVYTRAAFESGGQSQRRFPVPLWLLRFLLTRDLPGYFMSLFTFDPYRILRSELRIWTRKGQLDAARSMRKESDWTADKQEDTLDS